MATEQAHHQSYIKTDEADPDWAVWQGNCLAEPTSTPARSNLSADKITDKLFIFDKEIDAADQTEHWTSYCAKHI